MNYKLKFGCHYKELNCLVPSAPLILQVKSKTSLSACFFGLMLLNDLVKGAEAPLAPSSWL